MIPQASGCTKSDLKEGLADLKEQFALMKADIAILKWMTGFMLAAIMAVLFMLFRR